MTPLDAVAEELVARQGIVADGEIVSEVVTRYNSGGYSRALQTGISSKLVKHRSEQVAGQGDAAQGASVAEEVDVVGDVYVGTVTPVIDCDRLYSHGRSRRPVL